MKVFNFLRKKYQIELHMDIATNEDIPNYFFESEFHQTDFYEIIFFNKGNGYLVLDQQTIEITDQTIIFISPFQKRSWNLNKPNIACYFLFFQDSFFSHFFSDKLFSFRLQFFYNKVNPLNIMANNSLSIQLNDIFNSLMDEIKNYRLDSENHIRALLYLTLIKLNRIYADTYFLSTETETNTISYKFKQLLNENITTNRDIDFYAQKLAISRITLNKYIKLQFGITVSEMVNQFLLYEIKSKLLYSTMQINEIASFLNFSEANHLTRFFKKQTKYSPSQFRLTYQKGRFII